MDNAAVFAQKAFLQSVASISHHCQPTAVTSMGTALLKMIR
jgi:hypothetical protein